MTKEKFLYGLNACAVTYRNGQKFYEHDDLVKCFEDLELFKQEPKTGHWIAKAGKEQGYDIAGIKTWYIQIMCDKCGFIKTAMEGHTGQYKFCPNCGAKMEVEE